MINPITLDETSWVECVTGWLPGPDADELLAKLTANAAWEQRERRMVNRVVIEPRLTAEYNDLADAPDPALLQSAIRLTEEYGVSYDGLWINFYRDHRDSTGWHGDWPTFPTRASTSSTRARWMALLAASAARWSRADRPGWNALASSIAPTSRNGQRSPR